MAYLRWPTRLIQKSVSEHLKAGMTSLGWFDPTNTWAEHLPITWADDHDPDSVAAGGGPEAPNTVGISVGDVPDYIVAELGAGLQSTAMPMFVDVYGENRSVALSIADDIVGILQGQLWASSRYVPVRDWTQDPAPLIADRTIEARLVEARWPGQVAGQEWRHTWRMVAFTAIAWYGAGGHD